MVTPSELKKIRTKMNLSQAKMANKLGIKQSYYSAIERGEKEISKNVISALESNNIIADNSSIEDITRLVLEANREHSRNIKTLLETYILPNQQYKNLLSECDVLERNLWELREYITWEITGCHLDRTGNIYHSSPFNEYKEFWLNRFDEVLNHRKLIQKANFDIENLLTKLKGTFGADVVTHEENPLHKKSSNN